MNRDEKEEESASEEKGEDSETEQLQLNMNSSIEEGKKVIDKTFSWFCLLCSIVFSVLIFLIIFCFNLERFPQNADEGAPDGE